MKDFVTRYMDYVNIDQSEAPANYHRWTCLSIMGAYMGRQIWLPFGHSKIYPNQYILLMGSPGTRKGTAMGIGKALIKAAGYTRFAKDKTSKERFLMDLKEHDIDATQELEELEDLVFGQPAESYIMSGEFTDFIGQGNMEFITMLTNLWDNLDEYENPKIHGKSVKVSAPTINLFGGNTVAGFALAFPPEALGNGFLSRVLLVHGDPTGVKIAWPEPADEIQLVELAAHMREVRDKVKGEIKIANAARTIGKEIYEFYTPGEDSRFAHYGTRRFTHLLKISMLLATFDMRTEILEIDLIRANTVLVNTERKMPQALGEYGKNKHSEAAGIILDYLGRSTLPKTYNEIFKACSLSTHFSKQTEGLEIMNSLKLSDKIQTVNIAGKAGYVRVFAPVKNWPDKLLAPDWLHIEEYS